METINVELFGQDPKVERTISMAKNVAVTKATILIVGEIGVGKRSLGNLIHMNSNRANNPILVVDCTKGHKDVENAILGFSDEETGRFRKGAHETDNGGTVILANVDGLEDEFQKRIHKILVDLDDYDLDVRIVATT
ncbi:MAG: hypothetical protein DRQ89_09450, partial [Epsilonproteobacteria bacterium]